MVLAIVPVHSAPSARTPAPARALRLPHDDPHGGIRALAILISATLILWLAARITVS
jgi:hypothetical protein